MKRPIDQEALLSPIPGENPAGEDLRYAPIYEDIKEARRADDPLDRGDWQREVKTSDWDKVIALSLEALGSKTKDLQLAAWLTEALTHTEGFEGLAAGLNIVNGLLRAHWENLYPEIEEGDLDFRAAPLEFMNDKLWLVIKAAPLTEPGVTPGYSWLKWQESRQVGYEKDTLNQYGDADEKKGNIRSEAIAEGKLTGEAFDSAVALSSKAFYASLSDDVSRCLEEFKTLDEIVDQKFGADAPRLAELREALEDCERVVKKFLDEKRKSEPDAVQDEQAPSATGDIAAEEKGPVPMAGSEKVRAFEASQMRIDPLSDPGSRRGLLWDEALQILESAGIQKALSALFVASCGAPSVREKNNYRLLMAKLCLKAERPDLARPIIEELHALIEELNLERWESPVWIGDVLDVLYQCLTMGEPSDDDASRARDLLRKLCTTDVTKAMIYRD